MYICSHVKQCLYVFMYDIYIYRFQLFLFEIVFVMWSLVTKLMLGTSISGSSVMWLNHILETIHEERVKPNLGQPGEVTVLDGSLQHGLGESTHHLQSLAASTVPDAIAGTSRSSWWEWPGSPLDPPYLQAHKQHLWLHKSSIAWCHFGVGWYFASVQLESPLQLESPRG